MRGEWVTLVPVLCSGMTIFQHDLETKITIIIKSKIPLK